MKTANSYPLTPNAPNGTILIAGLSLEAGICPICRLKIFPARALDDHLEYHRLMDLAARTAGKRMPEMNPVKSSHKTEKLAGIAQPIGVGRIWSKQWNPSGDRDPGRKPEDGEEKEVIDRRKITPEHRSRIARMGARVYWRKVRALPLKKQGMHFKQRRDRRAAAIAQKRVWGDDLS